MTKIKAEKAISPEGKQFIEVSVIHHNIGIILALGPEGARSLGKQLIELSVELSDGIQPKK